MDTFYEPRWSILSAKEQIARQVNKEATREWGRSKVEKFQVIPPLKAEKWDGPALHVFGRGVYREIKRLIP